MDVTFTGWFLSDASIANTFAAYNVANAALIKSLKDTALVLPRSPDKQQEAQLRGRARGRWPITGSASAA